MTVIRHLSAAAALAAFAAVAACGSGNAAAPTAPDVAARSTTAAAASNALTVEARDYAYAITGSPRPGLLDITLRNTGHYAHEMGVSLAKPGVTLSQITTALKGPNGEQAATKLLENPDAEYPVPSIVGPGLSSEVHATLAAGHYVVICFLPGPGGMPHAAMGMIGEFTVAGAPSDARPPATAGTVSITDSGIALPAGFAGGGTFAVTNTGTKPHDLSLARLKTAGTLPALFQCVGASFSSSTPIDHCAGTLVGGVSDVEPGQTEYLTVHLTPGHYGYVSTAGDGADVAAGLAGEFPVT